MDIQDFQGIMLVTRFLDTRTGNIWRFDCVTDLFFIERHDMRLTEPDENGMFYALILVHYESPRQRNLEEHYP